MFLNISNLPNPMGNEIVNPKAAELQELACSRMPHPEMREMFLDFIPKYLKSGIPESSAAERENEINHLLRLDLAPDFIMYFERRAESLIAPIMALATEVPLRRSMALLDEIRNSPDREIVQALYEQLELSPKGIQYGLSLIDLFDKPVQLCQKFYELKKWADANPLDPSIPLARELARGIPLTLFSCESLAVMHDYVKEGGLQDTTIAQRDAFATAIQEEKALLDEFKRHIGEGIYFQINRNVNEGVIFGRCFIHDFLKDGSPSVDWDEIRERVADGLCGVERAYLLNSVSPQPADLARLAEQSSSRSQHGASTADVEVTGSPRTPLAEMVISHADTALFSLGIGYALHDFRVLTQVITESDSVAYQARRQDNELIVSITGGKTPSSWRARRDELATDLRGFPFNVSGGKVEEKYFYRICCNLGIKAAYRQVEAAHGRIEIDAGDNLAFRLVFPVGK